MPIDIEALGASGFLGFDDRTKLYGLGPGALKVGLAALRSLDVTRVTRPYLEQLVARTQETATLLLEIDDKHDEVAAALKAMGIDAVRQGAVLAVEGADDAKLDAMRDVLAQTGARLRRLAPRRGTLTDIFRDSS
mgnify:CR=1 FL=1